MSFRPQQAIYALVLLAVATSVATSQTPQGTGAEKAPLGSSFAGALTPARMQGGVGNRGETASAVGAAGDMIGFSHSDGSGTQTITLVHTGKSWMAVYHVDRLGKVQLVSSRPIDADFSLQLNATSPLPEEIRRIGSR